jgi:copper(I)-binding protein
VRVSVNRGIAAAALVVTLAPLTAGCGSDFTAGSRLTRPDTPEASIGDIKVKNVLIVAADAAERAVLTMAIVNEGDAAETLDNVQVEGAREATIGAGAQGPSPTGSPSPTGPPSPTGLPSPTQPSGGKLEIPAHGVAFVGSSGGPAVTITRNGDKPALGDFAEVTLSFGRAGQLLVTVPVVAASGPYATLTPTATPTPTPTATARPARGRPTPRPRTTARTPAGSPSPTP